jgi:hypothetical protein
MAFMDEIDETAKRIGAISCVVVRKDGSLKGSNNDGYGYINSILEDVPDWKADAGPVVIMGAGGGARAVSLSLADRGAKDIRIINRSPERAQGLAREFGAPMTAVAWDDRHAALEDAASPEKLRQMTLRENMALHASNPLCASCHSRMDPLGLALENFNALGQWRTTEMNHPIEPAGQLITGEKFTDIRGLKHILATDRRQDFYRCVSEKLFTYALGRGVEYSDTETIDQLVAQLEASGGRPSVLIRGIIASAPFQQRRRPAPTEAVAFTRSVPALISTP